MRMTVRDFQALKAEGQRIVMVTAYDLMSARLAEKAGVPALLVGDTVGMVVQGHKTPIPVTLDHMIYHAAIVTRNTEKPLIIGDLPFMTYNISPEQALASAACLMQEGGVMAVKLEGGQTIAPTIRRLVEAGIPVMGHIGLQPQSVHQVSGMRVQGRDLESAVRLVRDADAVAAAGAFAIVLETVPVPLAQMITERLSIPTIGIGAGPYCDGQVQVFHDLLGLYEAFVPRHTRQYAQVGAIIQEALAAYARDVRAGAFPTEAHGFTMREDVLLALREQIAGAAADTSEVEGHARD